ncbi:AAA family ATPase [Endozoicomonas arenosclerae]|uniref:AAA family ATPase n=1 Tax=Endozoicomonas arenosclerae TaxID=1633495 RepID=UPI000783C526|nr:AAA family ATPase [Endozoicomonas arenosclerae]
MHFIILFGPPAVGKMTIGKEIEKLAGLKLFHNHMAIEPVLNFFEFGSPSFKRLVDGFRTRVFEEVSQSDLPGLVFTYVWDLDSDEDRAFVERACKQFEAAGAKVALVELYCKLDQRLERNRSPQRLEAKPSKRNVEQSEANLLRLESNHRLNTEGTFAADCSYFRLDTTELLAEDSASRIVDELKIPVETV